MEFAGTGLSLSQSGFDRVVSLLGVGAAEVWTVLAVETKGCGFLANRRPLILFERHIFQRKTNGIHDATDASISSTTPGGYLGGLREYERLARAIALNRAVALESASWGIGQVMGFNASLAGFSSAESMVREMVEQEDAQLLAMAKFLKAKRLHTKLADHDWEGFARGYNGPAFKKNQYDTRLAAAFRAFRQGPRPDLSVRQVQVSLMFLGIDTGAIDGIIGKRTRSGIVRFREEKGLRGVDDIDDELIAALVLATGQASAVAPA